MTREPQSIDDLQPAPYNPRDISKAAADGLAASVEQFGDISGITWNARTGNLVCGHQRLEALKKLGFEFRSEPGPQLVHPESDRKFAIRVVDWPLGKEKRANVAANSEHIAGAFNSDLQAVMADIKVEMPELEFKALRFDKLAKLDSDVEEDETPEPPKNPVTKPGDVWTLGRHTVVCGDALALAVPGAGCIVVTDPPYGVSYDPIWREELGEANRCTDKLTGDDRVDWSALWQRLPECALYSWCAPGPLQIDFAASLVASGFELRQQLVWVKPYPPFSRSRYSYRHEPCWFATKGAGSPWVGDSKQASVTEAPQPGDPYGRGEERHGHPTQKPVECMARPIRNHAGDVYDPFLGSGTTLIAAEQLDRTCYGIEIEPAYVDVVVERWQNLTGGKATRASA